ncbi:MAG TPA: flagellar hook-basal body complex protein FliE [Stenotrophomonas sp.]|nr:flagellar hook-basal body complex protein FliE [Stenotrophomonas sp.]
MSIEAVGAISAANADAVVRSVHQSGRMDFSSVIGEGLQATDQSIHDSDSTVRAFAAGQEVAPHELIISLEEARMRLMLLSEVRNKLVEGYQELSRMQL